MSGNISGFIRRLFLQLMLEDEKVSVFLQSPCPVGTAAGQERFHKTFAPEILTLPVTQKQSPRYWFVLSDFGVSGC